MRSRMKPRSAVEDARARSRVSTLESASSRTRTRGAAASTRASVDALLLPARERDAALADDRVEARAASRRRRARGRPSRRPARPRRRRRPSSAEARCSRGWCARRGTDPAARSRCARRSQRERQRAHVAAVEQRRCPRSTSKSRGRSCTSVRLAGAGPADDRHRAPGRDREVDVVEHRAAVAPRRGSGSSTPRNAISPRNGVERRARPAGSSIAGSTAKSSFSRCIAARPRCRIDSIQPSAIVGQASMWR